MFEKLKTYNDITHFSSIARRYFVNNFYDGMLTILGILLGFFVIIIKNPDQPTIESSYIILTGLGTSISMLISGISGSYLSEKAEQKKGKLELDKAMGIFEEGEIQVPVPLTQTKEQKDIQRAMVTPLKRRLRISQSKKKEITRRKRRTLHEKAESFTGIIVSLVNGMSPFLGGVVPIIPFFFIDDAGFNVFVSSFVIILICIVLLGVFLGKISHESMIKNVLQMVLAFFLTLIITVVFLG